jgi:16S rRNA (cytosine1402-N4)-methyltransferase
MPSPHVPVLLAAVLDALIPHGRAPDRVIDGTVGAGGHAHALLAAGAGSLLGFDRDADALAIARETLAPYLETGRAVLVHASYAAMREHARAHGWGGGVDAILLDLGVSSMQLDRAERGFAFMREGPLDMRFDQSDGAMTAADIVNVWDVDELTALLRDYGEEPDARRVARAIVAGRPYRTTRELADAIKAAARKQYGKPHGIHPATLAFQAIRIAVNDELASVERTLPVAIELLRPGGRLAVISFHSLEDRRVKTVFREAATEIVAPPGMKSMPEKRALGRVLTRKPIEAGEAEVAANPRSRSAKLRVFEKF